MATDSRRQLVLLGALAVVLAAALWWQLSPEPAPTGPASPPRAVAPPSTRRGGQPGPLGVEPVRLDVLQAGHARPAEERRDPFRFRADAPAPPPQSASAHVQPGGPGGPGGPDAPAAFRPTPSGPPPMMLKFIGILKPTSATPIAVLTDGKNVFYGREGETVDGRYRIQRIGVESIEMEWADGRGRQVLRLSGS